MRSKVEQILHQVVEELERGESVDECLKKHEAYESYLRPLLLLVKGIESIPKPQPRPEAVAEMFARLSGIAAQQGTRRRFFLIDALLARGPVLVKAFAVVLLVTLIGWTTVLLSAKSLPGDMLYPIKTFSERIQYFLTINPQGKAELHLVFAGKRTDEFVRTLKPGEKLNRGLLMRMLEETRMAFDNATELSQEQSLLLYEKLRICNERQMTILAQCEDNVCQCDKEFIGQAINTCLEQRECIDCKMYPDSTMELQCPCL